MREYHFELSSQDGENLAKFDAVILATDHDEFDFDHILKKSKLVMIVGEDTRKILKSSSHIKHIKRNFW